MELTGAQQDVHKQMVPLASRYNDVLTAKDNMELKLKQFKKELAELAEEMLLILPELGGDQRFTLDGVITIWPVAGLKVWVGKENRETAIEYFAEHEVPGIVMPNYSSMQPWAKEIWGDVGENIEGNPMPAFLEHSIEVKIRHRRA